MSFAAWLTGRPASGKSAIARELVGLLHERGVEVSVLESDVMRTQLTPFPRYDDADRDFFYGTLAEIGAQLVNGGRPVVFDATANRRAYRDAGRKAIERFAEVYVDTPLEICKARDPKGLYRGGMTIDYEPPLTPELVIDGSRTAPAEGARAILALLEKRAWV
ncbi:MAG TPA: adenylyl-sulfate kinase [Burkholderiales bacterium]